jgi:hypothetical protein
VTDVPFHLTVMGRRFYETTMPALVEAIERLNTNIARVTDALAARTPPAGGSADDSPAPGRDG